MSDRTISLYVVDGDDKHFHTDPDAILAALAEAGVLRWKWEKQCFDPNGVLGGRYVSPWKEAK